MTFGDAPQGTPTLAIASLVLAILGFVTICLGIGVALCLVALILGVVALNNVSASDNRLGGHRLALAGALMGGVDVASSLLLIALLIGIMLPALGAARRTADNCRTTPSSAASTNPWSCTPGQQRSVPRPRRRRQHRLGDSDAITYINQHPSLRPADDSSQ